MKEFDKPILEDESFEALLEDSLPEVANPKIIRKVTPFRGPMDLILVSFALGIVSLEFGLFQLILPIVSFFFGLFGWYALRKENRGFRLGWILILARTVLFVLELFAGVTIFSGESIFHSAYAKGLSILDSPDTLCLHLLGMALFFGQFFALREGIRLAQEKIWPQPKLGPINGLIIWYAVVYVLALLESGGFFSLLHFLIVPLCLLKISKLTSAMDAAGYLFSPAPAKLRPAVVTGLFLTTVVLGSVCCNLLWGHYSMRWSKNEVALQGQAAEVAEKLKGLGYPEEALNDLREEDLLRCTHAISVLSQEFAYYSSRTDGLCCQRVAVLLSESPSVWQLFYHFSLPDQKYYWGSDCLQLRPAAGASFSQTFLDEPQGWLLQEKNGQLRRAPIQAITKEQYSWEGRNIYYHGDPDIFLGQGDAWFVSFSPPISCQNVRGYVTLKVQSLEQQVIYTHQIRPFEGYPLLSAKDYSKHKAGNSEFSEPFEVIRIESWGSELPEEWEEGPVGD